MDLSERGQRMLEDLPPYLWSDPNVRAYVNACALELDRLEARAGAIRSSLFPQNATDADGVLSVWEALLGLPVDPAGESKFSRRARVLAMVRRARAGQGQTWVDNLTRAIGAEWTHQENAPGGYQLRITLPYEPGSFAAGVVERIARRLTPANIELVVGTGAGFIVGVSEVGDAI